MRKQLTAVGNSWAMIIDKPILDAMGITPKETEFEMKTMDNLIVFEPIRKNGVDQAFKERVRRVMQKHEKTLRKLAVG